MWWGWHEGEERRLDKIVATQTNAPQTDRNVDGNLLVTPDTKGAHSVPRLGVHGLLVCQLLQNLGRPGQPVARLAHAAVDNELINLQLLHNIGVRHGCLPGVSEPQLSLC